MRVRPDHVRRFAVMRVRGDSDVPVDTFVCEVQVLEVSLANQYPKVYVIPMDGWIPAQYVDKTDLFFTLEDADGQVALEALERS